MHPYTLLGSEMSMESRDQFREKMKTELARKPYIAQKCS